MEFDDYNYKLYNPYILLKEPEDENEKKRMARVDQMTKQMQGDMTEKLSQKTIDKYGEGEYVHEVTHIEPSERERKEAAEREKERKLEEQMKARLEEEKSAKLSRKQSHRSQTGTSSISDEGDVGNATASAEDETEKAVQEVVEEE